jgi:hypothetical protein
MIPILFFVMNCLIGSQELLLLNTAAHFSSLTETTKSQSCYAGKNLDMLQRYHDVCMEAYKAIQEKKLVPDHVWYRVKIAQVIYGIGFDIFNTHIKPLLFHWTAVLPLYPLKSFPDGEWKGTSVYFQRMIQWSQRIENGRMIGDGQLVSEFGYGEKKAGYYYFLGLVLCLFDGNMSKTLFYTPSDGIVFCNGFYYGLINYNKKKAFLYVNKRSQTEIASNCSSTPVIDFGGFLPWDIIKGKRGELFFNGNMMQCSWWNSHRETDPIWSECYKFNDPYETDFSQPEIYS